MTDRQSSIPAGRDRPCPALLHASIQSEHVTALRLRSDSANFGLMPVPEREDAYFVGVKLRAMTSVRMWYGEKLASAAPMPVHALCFTHFDSQPHAELYDPFDCMIFKVPSLALSRMQDDAGVRRIGELRCPAPGTLDPLIGHLAACLLPAMEQPASACPLFVDAITRALNVHVLRTYGNALLATAKPPRGGLAAWQRMRVEEVIHHSLDGNLTLAELAGHCGLSVSHFGHAFKESVGQSPYQFLIEQRLIRARELMLGTSLPLAEIAQASGFGTQAHFNRRFVRAYGISPGLWRRLNH